MHAGSTSRVCSTDNPLQADLGLVHAVSQAESAAQTIHCGLILNLCMQTHKQSLQRKLHERQVEVQSKQEQLSSVLAESDAMRGIIAAQTVNKDDVARMNQEK